MDKKALNKDIYKEFTKSISRFISIMVMIALGSFIFVGLNVTGPTMRNTILTYVDIYNLEDLMITSPLGLEIEDEIILSSIPGVEILDYSYRSDVLTRDSDFVVRIEAQTKMPGYEILGGRLPLKVDEIALDGVMIDNGYKIGDKISFIREKFQGKYALKSYDYTIVGFVNSPEYLIPAQKGSSSIGDGQVDCFGVISADSFNLENYSLARLTFNDVDGLDSYSDEYKNKMKAHINDAETAFAARPEVRLNKYREEGFSDISTAEVEISDAERELLQAKQDLNDAGKELENAWAEYKDGKTTFDQEIKDAQVEITKGQEELWDAKDELDSGYVKLADGEKKLSDAKAEYADAVEKLADAGQQLEDGQMQLDAAQAEIDDGRTELAEKEAALYAGLREIDAGLIQIQDGLGEIDTGLELIEKSLPEIESGLRNTDYGLSNIQSQISAIDTQLLDINSRLSLVDSELSPITSSLASVESNLNDVNEQLVSLANTLAQLETNKAELEESISSNSTPELLAELASTNIQIAKIKGGFSILEQKKIDLETKKTDLENQQAPLTIQKTELLNEKDSLDSDRNDLLVEKATLKITKSTLLAQQTELLAKKEAAILQRPQLEEQYDSLLVQKQLLQDSIPTINEAKDKLDAAQEELDAGFAEFYGKESEYEDGLAELEKGRIEIADGEVELADARVKLEDGQAEYDKGEAELADAMATLSEERVKGENELKDAYQKILDGERKYDDGYKEYISKLPDAERDIEQGKSDINEAKNQLALLKVPDYTIQDRYKDVGFYQYIENSESMDLLSSIFPVFFFLIALLVSLTTMTRMVDEQRILIGTLKAIGYSNWDVIKKYLVYGSMASIIGSAIGIIGGQKILMPIVFNSYSSNFLFEEHLPMLSPIISIFALIISLFCTGFVALLTTSSSLKDNVSTLLRPKAPKIGNRIFLERLTPVWRRLSFNYKVTSRNIFRYKKRMLMTILGVAGCTALIFMGFAIKDSVGGILDKQYGDLFRYDTIVIYDENAAEEDLQNFSQNMENDGRIAEIIPARFEQGIVQIPEKLDQTINVVIPEDEKAFRDINRLQNRKSKEAISLDDGAVITEKIADMLDLNVGDKLEFKDNDETFKSITVTGITENYTSHYMYLPANYYEEIFGKDYRPNSDYILLNDHSDDSISSFSKNMLENDVVMSTVNTSSVSETVSNLMASLNIVVLVILLTSSLLAIVVLYNLTNINVSERIRELSTIMVLGFYPREVTAYVYRETMILTSIGIFIGYLLGLPLHAFIITAMSPSNVMMDPAVRVSSYILATAFTFAFSLVVMLIMHRRLIGIDMVEALKAVE